MTNNNKLQLFKIPDSSGKMHDFSDHVIAGTYNVMKQPREQTTYIDANGTKHVSNLNNKLMGSFDMYFKSLDDYMLFRNVMKDNQAQDPYVKGAAVVDNLDNQFYVADLIITFQLVRNKDGFWNDYYERFTVNIEEL